MYKGLYVQFIYETNRNGWVRVSQARIIYNQIIFWSVKYDYEKILNNLRFKTVYLTHF